MSQFGTCVSPASLLILPLLYISFNMLNVIVLREYKAQLAADRVAKLSGGTNQADLNVKAGKVSKKSHKSKDKKSHKSDKSSKKHKESKHSKKKHKSHDKDHKSRRKHSSDSSDTSNSNDGDDKKLSKLENGPVKLSDFLRE